MLIFSVRHLFPHGNIHFTDPCFTFPILLGKLMRLIISSPRTRLIAAAISCACLTACGGGGATAPAAAASAPAAASEPTVAADPTVLAAVKVVYGGTVTPQPVAPVAPVVTSIVTDVQIENLATSDQLRTPMTFGQVFAAGDLKAGEALAGQLPDGTTFPLQLDVKATHPDGSVRHAVMSASLPKISAGQTLTVRLSKTAPAAATAAVTPSALLASGFSAAVNLTLNGQRYTVSADELLKSGKYKTWLSGPVVNEWLVSAPLKNSAGVEHPHLSARFAIRSYTGLNKAKVDVTIENDWAFEPAPQNFTYDAQVAVGGQTVYSKAALTHLNHSRWRKEFWWGAAPLLYVKHNVPYLIASKAVPNYDQTVVVAESALVTMNDRWTGDKIEPMGIGVAEPYMPTTGGRPDIGLLPGWAASYLLSMDKRAKRVTLGMADLAGSWSSHYRNKNTDRPVSVVDFPYMTVMGNASDTVNPATQKAEAFPLCATATACATQNVHDTSHQPGFAYLPYLVTGDYYYLEELQFWAMWNSFSSNPNYRGVGKGLVSSDQVRGQAWSMRTLSEAAYITPDADPLKAHFESFLSNNLDWYNANYSNNPATNNLGVLTNSYAFPYENGTQVAPWMDDFFTSAVGHAMDLGFVKAKPILAWKSTFSIQRLTGVGACWIDAAIYGLKLRDSDTGALYATIGQAYAASHTAEFNALPCGGKAMADFLGLQVGEMKGYSAEGTGYPSNMQPAVAYAVDSGRADGAKAWSVFASNSVKPNYSLGPQFAIVPRR